MMTTIMVNSRFRRFSHLEHALHDVVAKLMEEKNVESVLLHLAKQGLLLMITKCSLPI